MASVLGSSSQQFLLNNRYQVIKVLGESKIGKTFLAEDTQLKPNKKCIVRELSPHASNPEFYQSIKQKFYREVGILEQLGSGGCQIPNLYSCFEENGKFYLVEDYIQGENLNQRIQNKVLSESQARTILVQLLPTLDKIHQTNLIYRKLKPENVILRASDQYPVLISVGAFQDIMEMKESHQNHLNGNSDMVLSGFVPSEQIAGHPVYSSDLYSLGLTAIYLLTGKYPQEFNSDASTGKMLWRESAPAVSNQLADILDKAIELNVRDRFSTAQQMLEALQPEKSNIPTTVIPAVAPTVAIPKTVTPSVAPTVAIPKTPYQQPVTQVSPTPTYSPQVAATPSTGNLKWVALSCVVICLSMLGAVFILRSELSSLLAKTDAPVKTTPDQTNRLESISEQNAVALVTRWLGAKREIFGRSYDRDALFQFLTDKAYECNLGAVEWLQNNGAYYTYGSQRIEGVNNFVTNGQTATIDVLIYEDRTLYNRYGGIDYGSSKSGQSSLRYDLVLINGEIKISYFPLPQCYK